MFLIQGLGKDEVMSSYMEKARQVREESDIHYNCAQGVLAAFAEDVCMEHCKVRIFSNGDFPDYEVQ